MKKTALLNSQLSAIVAQMGHTDAIAIGDCGLPIRGQAERVDLALKKGVPDFITTLETVLSELCVERAVIATETKSVSPQMYKKIVETLGNKIKVEFVDHEQFKKLTEDCRAVVRTGECTPYSNIILYSGVTF